MPEQPNSPSRIPVATAERSYQLLSEDDHIREHARSLHRNLGRIGAAMDGDFDIREGGLMGQSSTFFGSDFQKKVIDAWKPGIIRGIRLGKVGRGIMREHRQVIEGKYISSAERILGIAASEEVPAHLKDTISGINPKLWTDGHPKKKKLSFDEAFELISGYKHVIEDQKSEVLDRLPQWHSEAVDTLRELGVDEQTLEVIAKRQRSSQVHFVAPIEYYAARLGRKSGNIFYMAGDCSPFSGVKRLVLNKSDAEDYESTVKHEEFHSVSSHSPKILIENGKRVVYETRIGLLFYTNNRGEKPIKERYGWANEGVTQLLAQRSSKRKVYSYPSEVKLIEEIGKHIPLKVFLDAYLEPVDPGLPASERSPKLKKLVRVFHETFGSGSFRMIDDYITEHGGLHRGTKAFLDQYGHLLNSAPGSLADVMRENKSDAAS